MLQEYRVDLHIHSCLSPCADDSMTPVQIVTRAMEAGVDWIGIADHNAADNLAPVAEVAAAAGLPMSAGMEVTTAEEIHLLAFFDTVAAAAELGRIVDAQLQGENDEQAFGRQLVVDAVGEIVAINPKLLIGATGLTARELVAHIHRLGGLAIASHVDRPSFSIVSQLGFIPPDLALDAVELSARAGGEEAEQAWAKRLGRPVLRFSDAHAPEDVGSSCSVLRVAAPTIAELDLAIRGLQGRGVVRS